MNHNQKKKPAERLKTDICPTLSTKQLGMRPRPDSTKVIGRNKQPCCCQHGPCGKRTDCSAFKTCHSLTDRARRSAKALRRQGAPTHLRPKKARTPSEKPRKYGDIGVGPHREEKRNALRADRPLRMREDGWRAGRRAKKFPLPVSNGNLINRISMCIIQLWHPQLLPQRQVLRLRELQLQLLQQQVQPWQQTCVNDVYG